MLETEEDDDGEHVDVRASGTTSVVHDLENCTARRGAVVADTIGGGEGGEPTPTHLSGGSGEAPPTRRLSISRLTSLANTSREAR
mmetsp:Transcript_22457/g.72134  ORF Transcript_22457/g.72134 Transcript_22457/m.72134 type:complete len:85 (+) Transcript_22457:516-770(+)